MPYLSLAYVGKGEPLENTPRLYCELVALLGQPRQWRDRRHLQTFIWMMVGLIHSGCVSLTAWVPFGTSRARYAQSTQRRVARWLQNQRLAVHPLYAPFIQTALAEWGNHTLYLALDTPLLWNRYCTVRISVIYRGRAVPPVWEVLEQASRSVAYERYEAWLEAVLPLVPRGGKVVFLADRGVADTALLAHLRRLRWHCPIRIKANCGVSRPGRPACKVEDFPLAPGRAIFLPQVRLTAEHYGPVSLALA